MKTTVCLGAIGLCLMAAEQELRAETAPKPEKEKALETVEVRAQKAKKGSYTVSEMRSATGLDLSAKDTPQSVSVMTKQQLADKNITTLDEALKNTTGVNVVRDALKVRFQSRGFYIDQLSEDGLDSNVSGRSGYSDKIDVAPTTDLAVYDKIEIVRGATGLMQSSSEPGGSVNLIRKRPTRSFAHSGELSADHWGQRRLMLDVSGSLAAEGAVRGRAVGVAEHLESFKKRVDGNKGMLYGVVEADIGDKGVLAFGGVYQKSREVPDYAGIPMPCDVGSEVRKQSWRPQCNGPVLLPRDTYLGANWSLMRSNKKNLFVEYRHYFSEDWRLNASAGYTRSRTDSRFAQLFGAAVSWPGLSLYPSAKPKRTNEYSNLTMHPVRYLKDDRQYSVKFDLNGAYPLFGRRHEFYAGYSYQDEAIYSDYIEVRNMDYRIKPTNPNKGGCDEFRRMYRVVDFDGSGIEEPDWALYDKSGDHIFQPAGCKGAVVRAVDDEGRTLQDAEGNTIYEPQESVLRRYMYNAYENKARTHGLTLSTRFNLADKWHLLAGVRYTRYQLSQVKEQHVLFGSRKEPRSDYIYLSAQKGSRLIPYFGLTYDLTPRHSLYASHTKIFKPQPDSDHTQTKILPPTIGTNQEIGWKASLLKGRLNTSLALFRLLHKNRTISKLDYINWQTYADPVGQIVSKGLDWEAAGQLNDNWQIFAGYTYNRSRLKESEGRRAAKGMEFSRHTPKHMFRLYTSYHFPRSRWTAGIGVSAQSKTSSYYGVSQGGYAVWHANLQYALGKHANLGLTLRNLTDKRYFENNPNRKRGSNNFYGEPRTVAVKFDWKF